jgi:hypothetical protein
VGRPYVLCRSCRYLTPTGYVQCEHCGRPLPKRWQPPSGPFLDVDEAGVGLDTWAHLLTTTRVRIGRADDNDVVLDDRRVSPHHAVLRRDPAGAWRIEDLDSREGTYVNDVRVEEPMAVGDGDVVHAGGSAIRLVADRSQVLRPEPAERSEPPPTASSTEEPSHGPAVPWSRARKDLEVRPKAEPGWTLEHVLDEDGRDYHVLRSEASGRYVRLSERDAFLWRLMDGRHTVRDLLVAYLSEYHTLGTDRLFDLLEELAEQGFLTNVVPDPRPVPTGRFARARAAIGRTARRLAQVEFAFKDADRTFTRLYRRVAWPLFTRPGQAVLVLVAVVGLLAFALTLVRGDQSLFRVDGSAALGALVLFFSGWLTILVHELGHALTAKSYNRRVRRAGAMLYFGFLVVFVDTSDIWMEPRTPRIRASVAGPFSGLVVAGAASVAVVLWPATVAAAILFKVAAWSYITVAFNLNPLMELDGYYILIDWLEQPLLRRRALAFLRTGLWSKLRERASLTRGDYLLATFGGLSAVWSVIAVVLALVIWWEQIQELIHGGTAGRFLIALFPIALALATIVAVVVRRTRSARVREEPPAGA